ncbi:hypothetical protein JCM9279_006762 [Rhodotorula babjevae]
MARLLDLPPELVSHILALACTSPAPPTAYSLALTCRALHPLALPLLWSHLVLASSRSIAALLNSPDLPICAPHVRSIAFVPRDTDGGARGGVGRGIGTSETVDGRDAARVLERLRELYEERDRDEERGAQRAGLRVLDVASVDGLRVEVLQGEWLSDLRDLALGTSIVLPTNRLLAPPRFSFHLRALTLHNNHWQWLLPDFLAAFLESALPEHDGDGGLQHLDLRATYDVAGFAPFLERLSRPTGAPSAAHDGDARGSSVLQTVESLILPVFETDAHLEFSLAALSLCCSPPSSSPFAPPAWADTPSTPTPAATKAHDRQRLRYVELPPLSSPSSGHYDALWAVMALLLRGTSGGGGGGGEDGAEAGRAPDGLREVGLRGWAASQVAETVHAVLAAAGIDLTREGSGGGGLRLRFVGMQEESRWRAGELREAVELLEGQGFEVEWVLNVPPATRITRSASTLRKQVEPSTPASASDHDHQLDDGDDDMDDEIVLAPLPTRTTATTDPALSSQTRLQLARPGSSALHDRVSDATGGVEGAAATWEHIVTDDEEYDAFMQAQDEEDDGDLEVEPEQDDEDEVASSSEHEQDSRSEGEMQAIGHEMDGVERSVPGLLGKYHLVDRLGEGTFSSVYKAVDLHHESFDNTLWQPQAQARRGKVYVAVKRIYVTSSPSRIHNELEILHDLRGARNVAYLVDAIRHEDQVVAVMPFNRHQDFRTYYRTATLPLLRSYFSCLFRALAATHNLQIIHRDVKPANFLFDITTGQGILCDYGLAQKIGGDEWFEWKSDCLHSLPGPSWGGVADRKRVQSKLERLAPGTCPGLCAGLHGARLAKPLSLYDQALAMEREWKAWEDKLDARQARGVDVTDEEWDAHDAYRPWIMPVDWRDDIKKRIDERRSFYKSWRPALQVMQLKAKQRPGYLKEDRRPSVRANRAGTRGFRAPEVLLKCPDQTVALDIWSAGIILLCFLTRRFPFFNSNDDTEALAEITAIFGRRKMERCAALHNRTFETNIREYDATAHANLHSLVRELNPPIIVENSPDPYGPIPASDESVAEWYQGSEVSQVVDLMKRCLELDCTKRWTAQECLEHPFFRGTYDLGLGRTVFRESGYEENMTSA